MRYIDAFTRFFPKHCFEEMREVVGRAPLQALQHGTRVLRCRQRGVRLAGGERMQSRVLRDKSGPVASDSPLDSEKGQGYIRDTINVLESLDPAARAKIDHRNAERRFGLPPG
jgi:hypothetical protein